MPLGRDGIGRHARQLLLPEIGEVGQAFLSAHAVAVPGGPAGEVAAEYLRRAGVHAAVTESAPGAEELEALAPERVAALAGRPELEAAAAFLAGAFTAVEEMKRALGVGSPGRLSARLSPSGPEDVT